MGPAESHLNNVDSLRQAQRSVEAKPQDAIDPTHIEEFFDIEDSPKSKASAKQSKSAATALKRETTLAEPLLQGQESMPETIISMPEDVTTSKKSLVAENWKSFAGKSAKAPEFQSLTKAVSSYNKSELATLEQQHQALEVLHAEVQAARDHLNAATNLGRSDALTLIRNTELLDDFELELATLLSTQQQSTAHDPELDGPVPRVLTGTDAVQIALQQRSIKSEGLRDRIGTAVDDLVQAFTDELADKGAIPEKELKEVNQFLDKVTQPLSYGNLMEIIDMSAKSELIKTAQSRLEYLVLFGSTKAELAKQDGETFTDIVKQYEFAYDKAAFQKANRPFAAGGGGQISDFTDRSSILNKVLDPNGSTVSINLGELFGSDQDTLDGIVSNYSSSETAVSFLFTVGAEAVTVNIDKTSHELKMAFEDGRSVGECTYSDDTIDDLIVPSEDSFVVKELISQKIDRAQMDQLEAELNALAEVQELKKQGKCSNVMSFKGVSCDEMGVYNIFMKKEGQDLLDCLTDIHFSLDDKLDVATQLGHAVYDINTSMGGVHNDIKLQNATAIRNADGKIEATLIDLGEFTGFVDGEASTVARSVAYASPEQLERTGHDAKSDVFALGNVLINLDRGATDSTLCGPPDLREDTYKEMLRDGTYDSLVKNWLMQGTTTKYDVLVSNMVKTDPNDRIPLQYALELLETHRAELAEVVHSEREIADFEAILKTNMYGYNFDSMIKKMMT